MKIPLAAIIFLLFYGCRSLPDRKLADGRTRVPVSFRLPLGDTGSRHLALLDTSAYYRREFSVTYATAWIDTGKDTVVDFHLKFYSDGKFNLFAVHREGYTQNVFDPSFHGFRGFAYRGKGKDTLEGLVFLPVSGLGGYGYRKIAVYSKGTYLVLFRKDIRQESYFVKSVDIRYPQRPFPSW